MFKKTLSNEEEELTKLILIRKKNPSNYLLIQKCN